MEEDDSSSIKEKLLDLVTKAIPLLAAISLVASVSYDFFFIDYLGLSFAEVPTTLSDHVRSSIVWIPLSIVTLGFALITLTIAGSTSFLTEFTVRRLFKPDVRIEQAQAGQFTSRSKADMFFDLLPYLIFFAVFLVDFSGGLLTFMYSAMFVAPWAIKASTLVKKAIWSMLLIVILTGFIGKFMGLMFMSGPDKWDVEFLSANGNELESIRNIRQFADVAIIQSSDETVRVISTSDIKSIEKIEKTSIRENFLCQFTGVLCTRASEADDACESDVNNESIEADDASESGITNQPIEADKIEQSTISDDQSTD